MTVRRVCIIHYTVAGALMLLAVLLTLNSCYAWKFQSHVWTAVRHYDCANYAAAGEAISTARSYRPGEVQMLAFEAHLLALQGHHALSVSLLKKSGVQAGGIPGLALATEQLALVEQEDAQLTSEVAMLEAAVDSCRCPDAMVTLGGAYLRTGDLAGAQAALAAAADGAGQLTFDGMIALHINFGMLGVSRQNYMEAAQHFKKVLELLPRRKVPPLLGERKRARESAQRGLVLACVRWMAAPDAQSAQRGGAVEYVSRLLGERQAPGRASRRRWDLGDHRYVVFNALGVAQKRLRLHDGAIAAFEAALKEARLLRRKGREFILQGIVLNRALAVAGKARSIREPALKRRGELNKAGSALTGAAGAAALPAEWRYRAYNLSAKCYLEAGYRRKALKVLKAAHALAPSDPGALVGLAVLYDRENNRDQALKHYRQALKCETLKSRKEVEDRIAHLTTQDTGDTEKK